MNEQIKATVDEIVTMHKQFVKLYSHTGMIGVTTGSVHVMPDMFLQMDQTDVQREPCPSIQQTQLSMVYEGVKFITLVPMNEAEEQLYAAIQRYNESTEDEGKEEGPDEVPFIPV